LERPEGRDALLSELRRIVARELDVPIADLDLTKSLRCDYGLDSVAAVNILFELERTYDVTIDPQMIVAVDTVAEAHETLSRLLLA
jgi:acyl carrier protein